MINCVNFWSEEGSGSQAMDSSPAPQCGGVLLWEVSIHLDMPWLREFCFRSFKGLLL